MSVPIKTGWLNDKNGDKFAPKTLTSQIQTSDGILLEDKIKTDLETAKTEILDSVEKITVDSELSSTSTNPVQNKVLDAKFNAVSEAMNALETVIDGKSDANHNHNETYYTESEVDQKLENKADSIHSHDDAYDKIGTANTAVSSHNTSVDAHNDIRLLITDLTTKLNNFLDVDDATTDQLSEVLTLIDANKGTLESLTSNKINVSDIVNNLTTNSTDKVLSAAQGVAIKGLIDALQEAVNGKADEGHGHVINDVSGLQTALDSKAASSHNHTVANITDLTATTTELNYMSGVTSEVQTQIDGKANSSTTLAGYGITDAYTKSEVDGKIPTIEIVRW